MDQHTTTIGDHEYLTFKFGFEDGVELGGQVLAVIGDTLDLRRGLGGAISGFARAVAEQGNATLIYRLLRRTSRDGVKLDDKRAVEEAFAGNYGELLQAVGWVAEVNFAGFFEGGAKPLLTEKLWGPLQKMLGGGAPDGSWLTAASQPPAGKPSPSPDASAKTSNAS